MKKLVILLLVVALLVGTIPLSVVFCEEESSAQSGSLTGGEDSEGLGDPAPCGDGRTGGGGGPGPGAN